MQFSFQLQDLYKDLLTPTSSWRSFWALLVKQVASLKQNFSPRNKEIKGSVHYANQIWDILTCKVLQDSQRILSLAPIKLQLSVHNLPKTHYLPALLHFISAHSKHRLHLLPHFHCVQLRTANSHCPSLFWCPLSNCILERGKQHFCAPALRGATLRGKGSTGHQCYFPSSTHTGHFPLCLHPSSPILASK